MCWGTSLHVYLCHAGLEALRCLAMDDTVLEVLVFQPSLLGPILAWNGDPSLLGCTDMTPNKTTFDDPMRDVHQPEYCCHLVVRMFKRVTLQQAPCSTGAFPEEEIVRGKRMGET